MKNYKLNSTLCLAVFLMVFSACNKEQNIVSEIPQELESSQQLQSSTGIATDIQLENEVLVFKNEEDYRSTLLGLSQLSIKEKLDWEESIGFISMQRYFDELMQVEEQSKNSNHSEKYFNAIQSGFIIENDFGYDLNIFNPGYAPVLNKKGVVMVGKDLFQFTPNTLKIWKNGDIKNLKPLIQSEVSNQNIQIIPMPSGMVIQDAVSLTGGPYIWEDECQSEIGKSRLTLNAIFYSDFVYEPKVIFIKYLINIKSQIKDSQGNWHYDNDAKYMLKGISHSQLELTDGNDLYHKEIENDYYQEGISGNYFFIPFDAGEYQYPPLYFTQPAELINCQWRAQNSMSTGVELICGIIK